MKNKLKQVKTKYRFNKNADKQSISIFKSVNVDLSNKKNYTEDEVDGVKRLVIKNALISSTSLDSHNEIAGMKFLKRVFAPFIAKTKTLLVNDNHQSKIQVGRIENIVIDEKEQKVFGDVIVVTTDAIAKVKEGIFKALSIEGWVTKYIQKDNDVREFTDGELEAVALCHEPSNPDAKFAKSSASKDGQVEAIAVTEDEDTVTEPAQKPADAKTGAGEGEGTSTSEQVVKSAIEALEQDIIELKKSLDEAKASLALKDKEMTDKLEEQEKTLTTEFNKKKAIIEEAERANRIVLNKALKETETHKESFSKAQDKIKELEASVVKKNIHYPNANNSEVEIPKELVEKFVVKNNDGSINYFSTYARIMLDGAGEIKK